MIRRAKIERLRNYLSLRQKYLTLGGGTDAADDIRFESLSNEFDNIDAVLSFMMESCDQLEKRNLELEKMNSKLSSALMGTTAALESYREIIKEKTYDGA